MCVILSCSYAATILYWIQGCLANSYGANSYDLANSYGFSGKNLNSFIMIFSTFYRLPTRKFK